MSRFSEGPRKQTRKRNRRVDFDNLPKKFSKRLQSALKERQGASSIHQVSECGKFIQNWQIL